MSASTRSLALCAVVGALTVFYFSQQATPPPAPAPCPCPKPDDKDKDKRKRGSPWGPNPCAVVTADASRKPVNGGTTSPDGKTVVRIDLDSFERKRNISSRGLGCCGSRSLEYGARYVGVKELYDLPERMRADNIPGGDNQYTIARKMQKYAPDQSYIQDFGSTPEVLEALLKTHRIPCVGYGGHDTHYSGHVDHCVCVVACDVSNNWVAVLDNNYPGKDELVWMGVAEFEARWEDCMHKWVYALLALRPGGMPHQGEEPSPNESERVAWRSWPGETNEYSAWRNDVQIGNWLVRERQYYPRLAPGEWGEATDPPAAPPGWPYYPGITDPSGSINFGLAEWHGKVSETPLVNGKAISRAELLKLIGPELAPVRPLVDPFAQLREFVAAHTALVIVAVVALLLVVSSHPPKQG